MSITKLVFLDLTSLLFNLLGYRTTCILSSPISLNHSSLTTAVLISFNHGIPIHTRLMLDYCYLVSHAINGHATSMKSSAFVNLAMDGLK
jgi:hypothetical protein